MKNIIIITLLTIASNIHTEILDNPDNLLIITKFLSYPTQEQKECLDRCIEAHKRKTNGAQDDKQLVEIITACFLKCVKNNNKQ